MVCECLQEQGIEFYAVSPLQQTQLICRQRMSPGDLLNASGFEAVQARVPQEQ